MATTGVQKNFNRELAVLYPGTTLGSAAINDSKNYVNTASIGNASMAIGMMTQSYGTGSTAIGVKTLTKGIASTGIGVMARSGGDKSLALGSRAETYGNKSTAVGDANTVGLDMTDGTVSGASSAAVVQSDLPPLRKRQKPTAIRSSTSRLVRSKEIRQVLSVIRIPLKRIMPIRWEAIPRFPLMVLWCWGTTLL